MVDGRLETQHVARGAGCKVGTPAVIRALAPLVPNSPTALLWFCLHCGILALEHR